jgi:hypothetical protein
MSYFCLMYSGPSFCIMRVWWIHLFLSSLIFQVSAPCRSTELVYYKVILVVILIFVGSEKLHLRPIICKKLCFRLVSFPFYTGWWAKSQTPPVSLKPFFFNFFMARHYFLDVFKYLAQPSYSWSSKCPFPLNLKCNTLIIFMYSINQFTTHSVLSSGLSRWMSAHGLW